jgi:DNA mismatch endonuclease (patch repair protein)
MLHSMGFRFRLHGRDLPGTPDIVLPKYRTVIFVHGCFFHAHNGCPFAYTPKTRRAFWRAKFANNVKRDRAACIALIAAGWSPITIWECELDRPDKVANRLSKMITVKRFSK